MSDKWTCTNCLKENVGPNPCTFCGAASPDNFAEHARTFNRHGGIRGLADEIDALRAEVERAAATNRDLWRELGLARDLNGALRTERDDYAARLKATDQSWTKIAAENERLRLALRWVCEDAGVAIDGDYLTHADGEYAAPISDVHRSLVELVRSMGGLRSVERRSDSVRNVRRGRRGVRSGIAHG